jgi:LemA protein
MRRLWAVVESYPQLKSDRHFLELQEQLALTEDRIAATRRFYNGNVRELKQLREMFPTSIVASVFSIGDASYFAIEDAAERVVPRLALEN